MVRSKPRKTSGFQPVSTAFNVASFYAQYARRVAPLYARQGQ